MQDSIAQRRRALSSPRQSMAHKRPFPACASVCISLLMLGVALSLCCWLAVARPPDLVSPTCSSAPFAAPRRLHPSAFVSSGARVQASGRSKGRR
jgi:hypothetical protein